MLRILFGLLITIFVSFSSTAKLSVDCSGVINLLLQMLHSCEWPVFVGELCKQSLCTIPLFLKQYFLSICYLFLLSFCKFSVFFVNKM